MTKGQEKSVDELLAEAIRNPDPMRRPAPAVSEGLPTKGPGERRKTEPKELAELRENNYTDASKHGIEVAGAEKPRVEQGREREAPGVEAETESPSEPIDLAAAGFAESATLAQVGQDVTQQAVDPVKVGGLKALVALLSNIEPVVEMFRQPLLQCSRERPDFIPTLVSILDRLRAKLVDMSPVSIDKPPSAVRADSNDDGLGLSAETGGRVEKSGLVAGNVQNTPMATYRELDADLPQPNGADSERIIRIREAAGIVGLSPGRLKQLAHAGRIGELINGRFLFSRRELLEFKALERPTGRPPKGPSGS